METGKTVINDELLEKLDTDIDNLRIQFEQYFMGIRKTLPENERTALQYRIRRLANVPCANYAIKYKFQQLVAKFNSYNQYWERIIQRLESGQISRERLKAYLKTGPIGEESKPEALEGKGKSKKEPEELGSEKLEQIYQQLTESRKSLNQPINLSKEKLGEALKKQMAQIKEKYKDKKLEFEVVVQDGQAKLKAKAKK